MTRLLKESSSLWDIRLDKRDTEPVYLQIATAVRHLLRTGHVAAGSALPPEQVLAEPPGEAGTGNAQL
jgi:hypothetical protein